MRMRYAAFRKHSIMSHAHEICGAHHIINLWCTRDFMLCARHNFCQVSLKTSVMNVVLKVFEPLYKKFREVLHTSIPFNSYCMNLTTPPPPPNPQPNPTTIAADLGKRISSILNHIVHVKKKWIPIFFILF